MSTKGTIAYTVALFAIITVSSGSLFARTNVEWGVKGGLSLANFRVGSLGGDVFRHNFDSRTGYVVGAFVTINVNDNFAIQPEVLFSQKGRQGSMSAIAVGFMDAKYWDWHWEDRLNYLEVPVLVKLQFPMRNDMTPTLFVGPSFGLKLSAKQRWESALKDSAGVLLKYEKDDSDVSNFFKDTDFGITLGGGLEIDTKYAKIVLDVHYTLGLTAIDVPRDVPLSKVGTTRQNNIKNKVVSIMVGFAFPLGP